MSPPSCTGNGDERELQITAYLDGELDLTAVLDLERHLEECPPCAELLAAQRAMRQAIGAADLRFRPTLPQARRLSQALGAPRTEQGPGRPGWSEWLVWSRHPQLRALAALLLLAIGTAAGWSAGRRWPRAEEASEHRGRAGTAISETSATSAAAGNPATSETGATPATPATPEIIEQVLASHVRAQLAGHPEDVASSDRHTVKPWFAGHLDYSPPVVDLAADGFPLRGGRLEYVGGRPVAALVYQAGNHLVSVLVWPAGPDAAPGGAVTTSDAAAASSRRGFQLRHWSQAGMTWWAVSDVAGDRLDELVARLRAQIPPR